MKPAFHRRPGLKGRPPHARDVFSPGPAPAQSTGTAEHGSCFFAGPIRIVCVLGLLLTVGCVQIEQTVYLNRDRSGKIVEVIRLDDRLIKAARNSPEAAALIGKARAEERLAQFSGVTLASHEAKDEGDKGRTIRNVYSFKDINQVKIPALPNRNANWPAQKIGFAVGQPKLHHVKHENAYYHLLPFGVQVTPKGSDTKAVPNPRSPAEMEKLRRLLPYFRAGLKGFRIRLSVESFARFSGALKLKRMERGFQSYGNQVKRYDIFALNDSDLSDDDTLLKVLAWNRFPDPRLGTGVRAHDPVGYLGDGMLTHHSHGFLILLSTDIRKIRKFESTKPEGSSSKDSKKARPKTKKGK